MDEADYTLFCQKLAECGCIKHLFGERLLQPRVLVLERLQPLRLGDLHAVFRYAFFDLLGGAHVDKGGRCGGAGEFWMLLDTQ